MAVFEAPENGDHKQQTQQTSYIQRNEKQIKLYDKNYDKLNHAIFFGSVLDDVFWIVG